MSQQETYTKQESYSATASPYMTEANYAYNNFQTNVHSTPKSQHRYSSPAQSPLRTPSAQQQSRHYATPEESEAVLPIFSTPTHMYLRQGLNPQQRYSPSQAAYSSPASPNNTQYNSTTSARQNYSSTQQQQQQQHQQFYTKSGASAFDPLAKPAAKPSSNHYGRSRGDSTPSRPSMDHFGMNSIKSEINNMKSGKQPERTTTPNGTASFSSASPAPSTKDMLLAQLVDMGFSLEASRVAITATGSTDLQKILDILVQSEQADEQIPTSFAAKPTSSPSDDDDGPEDPHAEREQEELWKKQQEERRKEYLDELKRNKPTPPIPNQRPAYSTTSSTKSSTSTYQPASNISTPPAPPRTDPITVYADKERKQGNYFFNKGQYSEAEHAYGLSIGSLPAGHGDLVLLCNNRAAARLKQGKYQDCIADCSLAIDLARKNMASNAPITSLMRDASTNMKAQLIKALHRKASALEGLCLFEAAIQVYEEYVRLDGSRSAQVTQGIIRCQQALLDSKKKQQQQQQQNWKPATSADNNTTAFPDIDFNMFIPKPASQYNQAQLDEINKSKAVKEMRDREKQREAEEIERLEKEDKVNAQISVWKTGKDKNLRALLGSLELILWPGVQWKGVMMSELLEPRKCKVTYMKAIAKVHPDKLPANATVEQRMLANGIFTTLNQAWDAFKTENNL